MQTDPQQEPTGQLFTVTPVFYSDHGLPAVYLIFKACRPDMDSYLQKVYSVNHVIKVYAKDLGLKASADILKGMGYDKLPDEADRPRPAAISGPAAEIIGRELLLCAGDPAKVQEVISKFQRPNDTGRMRL